MHGMMISCMCMGSVRFTSTQEALSRTNERPIKNRTVDTGATVLASNDPRSFWLSDGSSLSIVKETGQGICKSIFITHIPRLTRIGVYSTLAN